MPEAPTVDRHISYRLFEVDNRSRDTKWFGFGSVSDVLADVTRGVSQGGPTDLVRWMCQSNGVSSITVHYDEGSAMEVKFDD